MTRKKTPLSFTMHTPRMEPWRIGISMPRELAIQLWESQNMLTYHGNPLIKLWLVLTNRYNVPRKVFIPLWDSVPVAQRQGLIGHACASAEVTMLALIASDIFGDTKITQTQDDLTAVLRWLKDAGSLDGESVWHEVVQRTLKATNPEISESDLKMLYASVKAMDKTLETTYDANDFEKVAYNIKLPDLPDDIYTMLKEQS